MKFMQICWAGLALSGLLLNGLAAMAAEPSDESGTAKESSAGESERTAPELKWWKGNLHTHSLWSDGDEFPEMIAAWYLDHGYNFLALSDHNTLGNSLRWMPYDQIVKRADDGILARYQKRFGNEWVETREMVAGKAADDKKGGDKVSGKQAAKLEVRLKPLDEFRCLFDRAGQFLMIQGEEISDQAGGKPLHMNATNVEELIRPVGGATIREVMQNNLRQVLEQEAATGREMLPHLNHPNFHYAVTADDLANVIQERFFEIFNGHHEVHQLGDHEHISIERMWDVANAVRLIQLDAAPLMGLGNDDSHEYHGLPGARPGRAWIMVRSRYLTPEYLIRAMKAGDFYASTGVVLDDVRYDATTKTLSLAIPATGGVEFTTEFVATLQPPKQEANEGSDTHRKTPRDKSHATEPKQEAEKGSDTLAKFPAAEDIGKVVATSTSLTPSYTFKGNEVYVRARVTSSEPHPDPTIPDQHQQAWTQPIVP